MFGSKIVKQPPASGLSLLQRERLNTRGLTCAKCQCKIKATDPTIVLHFRPFVLCGPVCRRNWDVVAYVTNTRNHYKAHITDRDASFLARLMSEHGFHGKPAAAVKRSADYEEPVPCGDDDE